MERAEKKKKDAAKDKKDKKNRQSSAKLREEKPASADDVCYLVIGGSEIGKSLAHLLGGVHAAWTDISVNTKPRDSLPEILISGQPLRSSRRFLVTLDSPRVHLGEGGTGLANAIYGFIFANMSAVNPPHVVFEFSEYAITLAELNRLHRAHGDAFPVQRISYYSHGIALTFTPDPPFMVKIASSAPGVGCYIVRNHDDIADVRSILALHNHYVTISVVFVLKRIVRLRCFGKDTRHAYECTQIGATQQWDRNNCSSIELTKDHIGWLDIITANLHRGVHTFGVEIIETDKGRVLIRDVDIRPDLLFPCASTQSADLQLFADHVQRLSIGTLRS